MESCLLFFGEGSLYSFTFLCRHIREHMTDYYEEGDMDEQLNLDSEEATQFHYFKLHDYDNNNKLDGLELYAAIAHFTDEHGEKAGATSQLKESEIEQLVDSILKQDDMNDDGFVDYYEFVQAQQVSRDKHEQNKDNV